MPQVAARRSCVLHVLKEARTRGFPCPPLGGFGFIGGACDLSIVAACHIGSGSLMSVLCIGHDNAVLPQQDHLC